jgi:hypothetical protein
MHSRLGFAISICTYFVIARMSHESAKRKRKPWFLQKFAIRMWGW